MLVTLLRVLLLYTLVVVVMRVMGKRQIGQLQPFELVIAIMIAELAAIPIADKDIPLVNGIIPIFTLLVAQVIISYASLKSESARALICGRPSILIENGKLLEKEMSKERYNINDLLEQMRGKGYNNIADVEFAILETNGQLSIIPKSQKRFVMPEDLELQTSYEGLPASLIVDGKINYNNLTKANLDETWLRQELAKFGVTDLSNVLIASLDTQGNLFYQTKEQKR